MLLDIQEFINALIMSPWTDIGLLGIIVCLLLVIYLKTRRKDIQLFKGKNGQVKLSLPALIALVQKVCNDFGPSSIPKVAIKGSSRGLKVRVKIKLFAEQNASAVCSAIQDAIENVIKESLGMEKKVNVEVTITGFAYKPNTTKKRLNSSLSNQNFAQVAEAIED